MPLPASSRPLLLRVASALRRAGAALARRARSPGRGTPDGTAGAAPGGEGERAFLSQVKETLLEISTSPEAPPVPRPAAPEGAADRPARLRRLAALLGPVRRHEDLVLVVALLIGIAMMILHWVP
jgi:hypothetical protein